MAKLIKLVSHSFLREHPFSDPISQPTPGGIVSPAQRHSYIYPGDELFNYHFLNFTADHPTALSINDLSLISAKVSIVAKRPGVYSEEYSPSYNKTRVFYLDTFVI